MAKPRKDQEKARELRPDGWERFSRAIDAAIKSGPKHRTAMPHKPHEESKAGKRKKKPTKRTS